MKSLPDAAALKTWSQTAALSGLVWADKAKRMAGNGFAEPRLLVLVTLRDVIDKRIQRLEMRLAQSRPTGRSSIPVE